MATQQKPGCAQSDQVKEKKVTAKHATADEAQEEKAIAENAAVGKAVEEKAVVKARASEAERAVAEASCYRSREVCS